MTDSSSRTATGRRATEADCDLATSRESFTEIEITPEMIAAGREEVYAHVTDLAHELAMRKLDTQMRNRWPRQPELPYDDR